MGKKFKVIGVMSGTSLDGIDIAYCEFTQTKQEWKYNIVHASTFAYSEHWQKKLSEISEGTALNFVKLDHELGTLIGNNVKMFIKNYKLEVDLVASHGHTLFHEPDKGITSQIGSGATIAAITQLPVVCDFRRLDVAMGGQGAPLVPMGDELLFSNYGALLNIGGIANVSYKYNGERIAFDICPANMILNEFARQKGLAYDDQGRLARSGNISTDLLHKLNALKFYKQKPPKSLGKEWVMLKVLPLIASFNLSVEDILCTFTEHIAIQTAKSIPAKITSIVLVSGGGAYNDFLLERIQAHCSQQVLVADNMITEFKEALIFAFLGLLRYQNEINTLSSVTGAAFDTVGGAIYHGKVNRELSDLMRF